MKADDSVTHAYCFIRPAAARSPTGSYEMVVLDQPLVIASQPSLGSLDYTEKARPSSRQIEHEHRVGGVLYEKLQSSAAAFVLQQFLEKSSIQSFEVQENILQSNSYP